MKTYTIKELFNQLASVNDMLNENYKFDIYDDNIRVGHHACATYEEAKKTLADEYIVSFVSAVLHHAEFKKTDTGHYIAQIEALDGDHLIELFIVK